MRDAKLYVRVALEWRCKVGIFRYDACVFLVIVSGGGAVMWRVWTRYGVILCLARCLDSVGG